MQALTILKAEMLRKSSNINIFALAIIMLMTAKTVLLLIFVHQYDYWFFINLMVDQVIIIVVFIYSLCKIMKVANKNSIEIYRCYLYIHFLSITLLMLTWGFDFFYYVRQQSICQGNCDYPPIWE